MCNFHVSRLRQYCENVAADSLPKTNSWSTGIGNVVAGLLTRITLFLMFACMWSKMKLKKEAGSHTDPAKEPLRQ